MAETKSFIEANAAKTKTSISPEERSKRYAELRARMGKSRVAVDAPAGIKTVWALKTDDTELSRLDYLGYKVVKEDMKPGAAKRFKAAGLKQDGTYVIGDVILMEISQEDFDMQKEIEVEDFERMRLGIADVFKQSAGKQDVPVFEVTEKNEKVLVKT